MTSHLLEYLCQHGFTWIPVWLLNISCHTQRQILLPILLFILLLTTRLLSTHYPPLTVISSHYYLTVAKYQFIPVSQEKKLSTMLKNTELVNVEMGEPFDLRLFLDYFNEVSQWNKMSMFKNTF